MVFWWDSQEFWLRRSFLSSSTVVCIRWGGHLRTQITVICAHGRQSSVHCTHRSWSSAHTKSRSSAHTAKGQGSSARAHTHTPTPRSPAQKTFTWGGVGWVGWVGWGGTLNVHFFFRWVGTCTHTWTLGWGEVGGVDNNAHVFLSQSAWHTTITHEHWDGVGWGGWGGTIRYYVFFSSICLAHASTWTLGWGWVGGVGV